MRLKQLAVAGLRNIQGSRILPGSHFNLLYGLNGQGKTSLLEAIFLLGNPRSFRNARLPELIRHGEAVAQVAGEIDSGGGTYRIRLLLEQAGRRVELDGKGVHRASELHGKLNSVVFSPEDTGMVRLGPEARRRYLDRAVYMVDIGYLHCWHDYHRILKQRNQLLKSSDKSGLDVWTEKLATVGAEVIERRLQFVGRLNQVLQRHYAVISGGSEAAGISYTPAGVTATDRSAMTQQLQELFDRNAKADERGGTTTTGPHRDDLAMTLNGLPLKSYGSQGQQKSFVLALKMAEMENLQAIFGEPPLLLLDDIGSELDARRTENLVDFLSTRNAQVFITTTDRSPALLEMTGKNYAVFRVENGNLTFEGNHTND